MNDLQISQAGEELYQALISQRTLPPFTERFDDITIDDAYRISLKMVDCRVQAGEAIVGKKIGVTSKPVMDMLGVFQPDFGFLTDKMVYASGEMPISQKLLQRMNDLLLI